MSKQHQAKNLSILAVFFFATHVTYALENSGFEIPDQGDAAFQYRPTGGTWTFLDGAGLSGPNSTWKAMDNSPDPLGDQFTYLQAVASISQSLTGLVVGATYDLSFFEAYRVAQSPSNDLAVVLNVDLASERVIYSNAAVDNPTWELRRTDAFMATNDTYNLTFRSNPIASDRSALIDGVVVNPLALPGPPMATDLDPVDDAMDVPAFANLTVTFNEAIFAGSGNVTISNVTDAAATVIPVGDARVFIANNILTIDPAVNLLGSKDYTVLMDAGVVVDADTNNFAGIPNDGTWAFTTEIPDLTAPLVATLSPPSGALEVARVPVLLMTFDEVVQKGNGDIVIKRTSDDTVIETIAINSGSVTVIGDTVTVQTSAVLDSGAGYYVEVASGAFEDLSLNPFSGITGNSTWAFTALSITWIPITGNADSGFSAGRVYTHAIDFGSNVGWPLATIHGVAFANGGPGTFPATNGTSQTIGTGSTTIPNNHNGNAVADPFLTDQDMRNLMGDFIFNDTTSEIELTGLTPGRSYQVRLYNRPWALGGNRGQIIEFSTDGQPGAEATASFNEDDATAPEAFLDVPGRVNALRYDYTATSSTLTININAQGGGTYHLYALTNEAFPEDQPPVITRLDPLDNAVDVRTFISPVATFDKFIQAGSGNIILSNLTDSAGTVFGINDPQITIFEYTLTIDPDTNLLPLKDYAVLIESNALQNQFGTPFGGISDTNDWSFTVENPDSVPPTLLGLSPISGTINVSRRQELTLTFDEPMQAGNGDIVLKRVSDDAILETYTMPSGNVAINGAIVTIQPSVTIESETAFYVEVAAGALEDLSLNPFTGFSGNSTWALTVHPVYFIPITSDTDSGISTNKLYTHAIDFGNNPANYPVANINGVVFANGSPGAFPPVTGTSATVGTGSGNLPASHIGTGVADPFLADPGMRHLVGDFIYNAVNSRIELTGLIPGREYQVRLYSRPWGIGGSREQVIGFNTDGQTGAEIAVPFNEDDAAVTEAYLDIQGRVNTISYTYIPTGNSLIINIDRQGAGTYHLYGLTNEQLVDNVPPQLVSLDPTGNSTNVVTYTDLVATFDIPIKAGGGNIVISNVTDGVATLIPATDPQVAINDIVLTVDPTTNLDPLDVYAILIESNALTNPFETPFAGITNATDWTFTIGQEDTNAPAIVSLFPANGEAVAAILEDFLVRVDEPIKVASGTIVLRQLSDDQAVETFDVNSNVVVINGAEITLVRAVFLQGETDYYVEVDDGAFTDLTGNSLPGITGNTGWRFSTTATGTIDYVPITGDADSGISTNYIYTHLLDFGWGIPGALINNVQFAPYNSAANGTLNFNRTVTSGALSAHGGNWSHNVTGSLVDLLTDMYYNANNDVGGMTTWVISGLTPGATYDTRIYVRSYPATPGLNRQVNLVFDPDGAGPVLDQTGFISEDDARTVGLPGGNQAYYISYTYTAGPDGALTITANQQNQNNSWHLYGLSTQVAGSAEPFVFTDINYGPGPMPSASFTFNSVPGKTYRIEAKFDLHSGSWIELVDQYSSQGFTTTFTDTVAAGVGMPRVYYRLSEND
jgi:hypothetical protein